MTDPSRATVIVTSRDRWLHAPRHLETLLERTDDRHRVIVVDGGAPRSVSRAFAAHAADGRIDLVRRERFAPTNEARRIALDTGVSDDWIAFVENDCTPDDGWLDTLIATAAESGAATTFPIYLWQVGGRLDVHGAGCDLEVSGPPGRRRLREVGQRWNEPWPESAPDIPSGPQVQCEPHCLVIRRDVLERTNGPDPELLGWFEHIDLALHHLDLGVECRRVSDVTCLYEPSVRFDAREVPTLSLRWGRAWFEHSKAHLCRTWGLDPDDPKWQQHERYRWRSRRQLLFDGHAHTNAVIDRAAAPVEQLHAAHWFRARRRELASA